MLTVIYNNSGFTHTVSVLSCISGKATRFAFLDSRAEVRHLRLGYTQHEAYLGGYSVHCASAHGHAVQSLCHVSHDLIHSLQHLLSLQVGLLPPDNIQQVDFAFSVYEMTGDKGRDLSREFKKTFAYVFALHSNLYLMTNCLLHRISVTVEFVGVW